MVTSSMNDMAINMFIYSSIFVVFVIVVMTHDMYYYHGINTIHTDQTIEEIKYIYLPNIDEKIKFAFLSYVLFL